MMIHVNVLDFCFGTWLSNSGALSFLYNDLPRTGVLLCSVYVRINGY